MQNELINRESKYYHEQAEMLYRNSQELKKFRHDTSTTILEVDKMQNAWKHVIKKRGIPNKRWTRF